MCVCVCGWEEGGGGVSKCMCRRRKSKLVANLRLYQEERGKRVWCVGREGGGKRGLREKEEGEGRVRGKERHGEEAK